MCSPTITSCYPWKLATNLPGARRHAIVPLQVRGSVRVLLALVPSRTKIQYILTKTSNSLFACLGCSLHTSDDEVKPWSSRGGRVPTRTLIHVYVLLSTRVVHTSGGPYGCVHATSTRPKEHRRAWNPPETRPKALFNPFVANCQPKGRP